MIAPRRTSVALLALLVGGCATTADLQKVERDDREMRALLADTQVSVERLRRDVDALRDQQKDTGRGGRSPALSDLDRRVTALDQRVKALEGSPPPIAITPTPIASGEEHPPEAQGPQSDAAQIAMRAESAQSASAPAPYKAAMDLYRRDQCDQAVTQLRQFIRDSPTSDYADNAQYWIGECYYGKKDYNSAIIEFNEVILKFPKGDRVPSALLSLATSFADSGDKIDARLILQKLIGEYPKSEEATVGRQKLQALTE